jgi:hypothetical protein
MSLNFWHEILSSILRNLAVFYEEEVDENSTFELVRLGLPKRHRHARDDVVVRTALGSILLISFGRNLRAKNFAAIYIHEKVFGVLRQLAFARAQPKSIRKFLNLVLVQIRF